MASVIVLIENDAVVGVADIDSFADIVQVVVMEVTFNVCDRYCQGVHLCGAYLMI